MTDREKLTALFEEANAKCARTKCPECEYDGDECWDKFLIDYLLANGVTFKQWIPVSERLPEIGDICFVVVKYKYDFEKEYTYDTDAAIYCSADGYIDDCWDTFNDWNEGQQHIHVTHWMPLPEPPKEVDNGC